MARKQDLDDITVEEWFSEDFLNTNFYMFWRTMFAFQNWHSVLEMKLYMHRFLHLMDGLNDMTSLVFPKYNQYDSIVVPLMTWLKNKGINIQYGTTVSDLEISTTGKTLSATAIKYHTTKGDKTIQLDARDLIFASTGSIIEDTAYGNEDTVPQLKVAAMIPALPLGGSCGKTLPRNHRSSGEQRSLLQCTGLNMGIGHADLQALLLIEKLKALSVNDPYSGKTVTGGMITFTDSAWLMSFTINRQLHFPNQPNDVVVIWVYALKMDKPGAYVNKAMLECTGKENINRNVFPPWFDWSACRNDCRNQSAHCTNAIHHRPIYATCQRRPTMGCAKYLHRHCFYGPICGNIIMM